MPVGPTVRHRSPAGHIVVMLHSWTSPMPHVVLQLVEVARPPMSVAQQTLPMGHVSAVHPSDTPMHMPGSVHVPEPAPPVWQQTCGGLHTA
jgi:hypothetical protein